MKYYKQAFIIITITLIAELLAYLIPLPIPASIYGMGTLFTLLMTGIIKLDQVEAAGNWLIAVMPAMFIVPAAGFILSWSSLQPYLLAWIAVISVTTIVIMVTTGLTAQFLTKDKQNDQAADENYEKGDQN